jgi:hypothetical protein
MPLKNRLLERSYILLIQKTPTISRDSVAVQGGFYCALACPVGGTWNDLSGNSRSHFYIVGNAGSHTASHRDLVVN